MEPRENIPRIMVELFERYGSSEAQIEILETKTVNGIDYITVSCREETFTLTACSLQVSENAYFMKNIDEHSCNTEKTKSRFYHRTGGILVMAKPCGIIVSLDEIFGGESVSQVAEVIESYLENCGYEPQCIVYDDACHLKRHVGCRHVYPMLEKVEMRIDRFHFQNHVDPWCIANMDPSKSLFLKNVNTEIMEQIFAWVKGYASSLRYMNSYNLKFFMLDIVDRHNRELKF